MPSSFPTEITLPKDEFEARYHRLSDTRARDPSLHFSLIVPRTWRVIDVAPEAPAGGAADSARSLLRSGEGEPPAEIEVHVVPIAREIAPADWLRILLDVTSHEVLESRSFETRGGRVADVLTKSGDPTAPAISRWMTVKSGAHMLVMHGRAREDAYESHATTFLAAAFGLAFAQPSTWPLAERLRSFTRAEPDDFLLLYPESWSLRMDPRSHDRALSLSLYDAVEPDAVTGTITVAVLSREPDAPPDTLIDAYWAQLASAGHVGARPPLETAPPTRAWSSHRTGVAELTSGRTPLECRVSVGQSAHGEYLVGLVGPARSVSAPLWAIHRRAHEIVVQMLKTGPAAGAADATDSGPEMPDAEASSQP